MTAISCCHYYCATLQRYASLHVAHVIIIVPPYSIMLHFVWHMSLLLCHPTALCFTSCGACHYYCATHQHYASLHVAHVIIIVPPTSVILHSMWRMSLLLCHPTALCFTPCGACHYYCATLQRYASLHVAYVIIIVPPTSVILHSMWRMSLLLCHLTALCFTPCGACHYHCATHQRYASLHVAYVIIIVPPYSVMLHLMWRMSLLLCHPPALCFTSCGACHYYCATHQRYASLHVAHVIIIVPPTSVMLHSMWCMSLLLCHPPALCFTPCGAQKEKLICMHE